MNLPEFASLAFSKLNTSYAIINGDGIIIDHAPRFPLDQPDPILGLQLLDILPELVGQEDALAHIFQDEQAVFRLHNINRVDQQGQIHFLTLNAIPCLIESNKVILVLVTDSTEAGEQMQELTQSRNELRLARRRLAELSYRLDYVLRHYLSADVADALLQGDLQPKLGGELREISILFADVRNFTAIAEQIPADQMVQLLNKYLDIIAGVVAEYDGLISQFQGDNLIVLFNASSDQPDHAQLAVETGIVTQMALATFQRQQPPEQARLDFGIGINTGVALVGNIGAKQRYSYTALGDPVNLAARITAAVPAGEVWFSQTTRDKLKNNIQAEPLPAITLKGKSQPTSIFKVKIIGHPPS